MFACMRAQEISLPLTVRLSGAVMSESDDQTLKNDAFLGNDASGMNERDIFDADWSSGRRHLS